MTNDYGPGRKRVRSFFVPVVDVSQEHVQKIMLNPDMEPRSLFLSDDVTKLTEAVYDHGGEKHPYVYLYGRNHNGVCPVPLETLKAIFRENGYKVLTRKDLDKKTAEIANQNPDCHRIVRRKDRGVAPDAA